MASAREWFNVRVVARPYGWAEFLFRSAKGDIPDCQLWHLGDDDHYLVRMRRITEEAPCQFDAECACGEVVGGDRGMVLPRVLVNSLLSI